MVTLEWNPGAREDFDLAIEWYEREKSGLGKRFSNNVDSICSKIRSHPSAWPTRGKGIRYCPVKDFPFNVVYTERPSTIWIVAVAHRSRRPDYWTKRLKDIPL